MARAPGRPKEPALSRRAAVAAALDIIDRDGLGALSIRSLAAALGVSSASLYHHFENKDEILVGVARTVLRDVTVQDRPGEPWQTQMVSTLMVLRRALVAHPNAVALILQLNPRSFAPEPYDAMVDILERSGVPPELTLTVFDACDGLVFGWALHSAYAASVGRGPLTDGRGQGLARLYEQSHHDDEARFEMACHALVQGFSAEIGASSPRCGRNGQQPATDAEEKRGQTSLRSLQ